MSASQCCTAALRAGSTKCRFIAVKPLCRFKVSTVSGVSAPPVPRGRLTGSLEGSRYMAGVGPEQAVMQVMSP